ncbi:MAG: amino acid--[acyl-carrier-protein] ligase [Bacteriovorax sp.]|nr:amino acid--[acyl-carrier-protein] ligase [Bacteriovorax sp.]
MCESKKHESYLKYRDELIEAGLLIPSGVQGVFGRNKTFEKVVAAFENYVSKMASERKCEVVSFSPILNRAHYLKTEHVYNFPDLLGSIHSFKKREPEQAEMIRKLNDNEDWTRDLDPTDVMMTPAACYPVYPANSGTLPLGGKTIDLTGHVFRHEPSDDPARMQIFRQREFVRLGTADEAREHRDYWIKMGKIILDSIGLKVKVVVANDPFFGRGGRLRKATQREQDLKHEFIIPICSEEDPTAIASCNYHLDSFGSKFDIKTDNGDIAHSSCIGFGLERVALALFKTHGIEMGKWPSEVLNILEL